MATPKTTTPKAPRKSRAKAPARQPAPSNERAERPANQTQPPSEDRPKTETEVEEAVPAPDPLDAAPVVEAEDDNVRGTDMAGKSRAKRILTQEEQAEVEDARPVSGAKTTTLQEEIDGLMESGGDLTASQRDRLAAAFRDTPELRSALTMNARAFLGEHGI